jgi:hypothetical protein
MFFCIHIFIQKDKVDIANNPYLMVRSRSEYYTSMSVSGLPTFLISVKNMNLLSSSIYKHLKTYLIKHKQSKFDRLYTIMQKNGGTDRKKKFSPTLKNGLEHYMNKFIGK